MNDDKRSRQKENRKRTRVTDVWQRILVGGRTASAVHLSKHDVLRTCEKEEILSVKPPALTLII